MPGGADGKASVYNAGDLGLIPGSALFIVSFAVKKLLSLIRSHLFIFICFTVGGGS